MYWGYSPALDVLNELLNNELIKDTTEFNIMIAGAADARHILKTLSKYYTHVSEGKKIKLNFYICEVLVELIARQLILLMIALEPPQQLGLKEKVRLFMEVYGNTIIRPKTATYIYKKSFQLVHCVTDFDYLKRRIPAIDLSLLKYKERDLLETIFKFWQEDKTFNISQLWNIRLRQSLGVRYDAKSGVFDWDYHMRLKDYPQGSRINSREYCKWRDSGIAFAWLETEVSEVNPTLASAVTRVGDRLLHHGYLGDIHNAPYINYGLDCEDEEMVKTVNGVCAKRATDIMERNLLRLFWEIEHHSPYSHPKEDKCPLNLGVVITELTELPTDVKNKLDVDEETQLSDIMALQLNIQEEYSSIELMPEVTITFLPTTSLRDLPRKDKFKNHFHLIWMAHNLTKQMNSDITTMLIDNGLLIVENKLYLVNVSKDDLTEYDGYIKGMFNSSSDCLYYKHFNYKSDYYANFIVKRNK